MDDKASYWASVGLSAVALLVLVTNVALVSSNRNLQFEVNQRQVALNNANSLSQLNTSLVQALAETSIKNDDKAIRDLLSSQGITIKPKGATAKDSTKK
jgi:hypothetical protein